MAPQLKNGVVYEIVKGPGIADLQAGLFEPRITTFGGLWHIRVVPMIIKKKGDPNKTMRIEVTISNVERTTNTAILFKINGTILGKTVQKFTLNGYSVISRTGELTAQPVV